ncbi:hypothetical protein Pla110_19520 [Polystyrenella longa]|uniref:Uncharacterized protein n=1 Tax=Polystyrenella longa TaxID=2528007 RepID=A0A518CLY1_9PLAN|nr:hypothetical protein [Polystyrenella longa]QDU80228.1 hypothetical protein Pla110_19520 [Polystyrenella longa]
MNPSPAFTQRAPSTSWESIPLDDSGNAFWAWFKPQNLPQGCYFQIPPAIFVQYANQPVISLRNLLVTSGISPGDVSSWFLYGNRFDAVGGTSPLLDQPVPSPPIGTDPNIIVSLQASVEFAQAGENALQLGVPDTTAGAVTGGVTKPAYVEELFRRMESDWQKSLEIERQLNNHRKTMAGMMTKLKGLNRDLTFEESLAATSQDKVEWQTTRSWLRNSAIKLSKLVKAFDIGITSSAGQRLKFADVYEKFIEPRIVFDGMEQTQRDIESYRKMMQTLILRVGGAQSDAAADGERRANSVLNKIAGHVRQQRVKNRRDKR